MRKPSTRFNLRKNAGASETPSHSAKKSLSQTDKTPSKGGFKKKFDNDRSDRPRSDERKEGGRPPKPPRGIAGASAERTPHRKTDNDTFTPRRKTFGASADRERKTGAEARGDRKTERTSAERTPRRNTDDDTFTPRRKTFGASADRERKKGTEARGDRNFDVRKKYTPKADTGSRYTPTTEPRKIATTRKSATGGDGTRLNKYIAATGRCSRREADELIKAGLVSMNGEVVTAMGLKVKPGDDVRFDGERIRPEKHVYILMNKPKDVITTVDDPQGRRTVLDLLGGKVRERVYPVGRLDRNTTGVLLLTNDGELAKKLTHPSFGVQKIYRVLLDKSITKADMLSLRSGVKLEDGMAAADEVAYTEDGTNKKEVGVTLHSGKNRVVRRMFEALGYEVVKLDRVSFAGLTKKTLERGFWRALNEVEIARLKMLVGNVSH
jgi:23S rRNA pseudouridine2605 synthase